MVGGAIRDIYLNRQPLDFDFAVADSGIALAKEFARQIRGKFVLLSQKEDEARVVFQKKLLFDFAGIQGKTIQNDLKRRDFTINALAIPLKDGTVGEIIDLFSGLKHLEKRVIVPVSEKSLALDPLRILRAFRFASELNFKVSDKVMELAQGLSLKKVAAERIGYELMRIMAGKKSFPYIKTLADLKLLHQIFPESAALFANPDLLNHSLKTYQKVEELIERRSFFSKFTKEFTAYFSAVANRRALLKLAGLLHDIAKPHTQFQTETGDVHFYGHDNLGARIAEAMVKTHLRLSRKEAQMIRKLIAYHMRLHLLATAPVLTDRAIRKFFRDLGDEYFGLMILTFADGYATAGRTRHLEDAITQMIELKRQWDAKRKITRLITGHDLIALGLKPGPIFKPILEEMEELQVEGKIKTKEEGLEYLKVALQGLLEKEKNEG
ncbi:MAG: HD domain-containing protein [candidate division WOR-3 bacterium]